MTEWPIRSISEVTEFQNSKRVPLSSIDRAKRQGPYPYYGASGIVDYLDDYIFDGTFLLISEDGENLRSRKTPIAFKASGRFWVNNHAHILSEREPGILDFLEYAFSHLDISPYITGAVQPKLNKRSLETVELSIPSTRERLAINAVLNSLTGKIKLNRRMNETLEKMARAIFKDWFVDFGPTRRKQDGATDPVKILGDLLPDPSKAEPIAAFFPEGFGEDGLPEGWEQRPISDLTLLLKRGITPKYTDNGALVVNQRCIRNCWLNFSNARRHNASARPMKEKELQVGDVLVNSTGVGTLGRVATVRELAEVTTADTHVTIVRPDPRKVTPIIIALLLEGLETEIEQLGHGSTGQTELKPSLLGDLKLNLGCPNTQKEFATIAGSLRQLVVTNEQENQTLAATRDLLLPKLMSGEIRIKDAEAMG